MKWHVLVVVSLVFLAGCGAGQGPTTEGTEPPTASVGTAGAQTQSPGSSPTPSPTPTRTPSPTSSPIPTPTFTPTPIPNPWKSESVIVGVNKSVDPDRNYAGLVQAAINYWETEGAEYTNYDVRFVVQANATNPDIVVRFVDSLSVCGKKYDREMRFAGCAPILSPNTNPDDPAIVYVLAGLIREDTIRTLKHEFGHVYGIDHREDPLPLMNETYDYRFISKPDVDKQDWPWRQTNFSVYIDQIDDEYDTEKQRTQEQVEHAMDYYVSDPDGWMAANISFQFVSNESDADIVIDFTNDPEISDGSVGTNWGRNIDTDDNLEYYTFVNISVDEIPVDRRGWHIGYWLGFAFGANCVDELPPPFDEPDRDPREDWWE